jgi:hypothetical protein
MAKVSPGQKAAAELADAQRKLCRDWLLYIMTASSVKTRTKGDLRAEAIGRFKVSLPKTSSGNHSALYPVQIPYSRLQIPCSFGKIPCSVE